jgi:type 1 fimbria pilin
MGATTPREFPGVVQSEGEKMKKLIMSIGACMLLTSGFAAAKDTTFNGEIMDEACAKDGGHESMFKKMGTNDPKVCTEACRKGGSKYVLFNADKTFYQLSDQKKPAPFAGQKVEATGTLNKATKTINLTAIKAAS